MTDHNALSADQQEALRAYASGARQGASTDTSTVHALVSKGLLEQSGHGEHRLTDAGRAALRDGPGSGDQPGGDQPGGDQPLPVD